MVADEPSGKHLLLLADVADLGDVGALIAGTAGSVRLTGPHAFAFAGRLAALADGSRGAVSVLSELADFPPADVDAWLAELASAGLLVDVPGGGTGSTASGRLPGLLPLGISPEGLDRLQRARVVLSGLDAVTAAAAVYLASYGVGAIEFATAGPGDEAAVGLVRDRVGPTCDVSRRDVGSFDELESGGAPDFLVGSTAIGLIGRAHWANQLALAAGIPAVFGSARGHVGLAGPVVFPGEGPCLLCYRMRALACADDFTEAMALEEAESPATGVGCPPLCHVADAVGGAMAIEAVKTMTAVAVPTLVGKVLEIDGLEHTSRLHNILQRHDCPACKKKARPPLPDRGSSREAVHPTVLRDLLVSPHCGVVRVLEPVPTDVTEPAMPSVLRAEVANNRFRHNDHHPFQPCSGKGMDGRHALMSALGEACERYAATAWSEEWVQRCPAGELECGVVSPTELVLFAEDQYVDLPYTQWDPDAEIGWVRGVDLTTGTPIAVPAIEALLGYEGSAADHLYASTSNGLAAGASFAHAALNGALEVIERDAFMISWLNQLGGTRIDPFEVPHTTVRTLAEAYRRRDVALELYLLPTDVAAVSVYVAIGVQTSERAAGPGPAAVVGLGADLDEAAAAAKAALEVGQVRPALKARLRDPEAQGRRRLLLADPRAVENLEDHDLLYSHPDALGWLSFWRDQDPVAWREREEPLTRSPADRLATLVATLADAGHRLIACDLTPPELSSIGIHVVRAVIPGFQPIHFGSGETRLGGRRLYELPWRLGLQAAPASRGGLNQQPHPIS